MVIVRKCVSYFNNMSSSFQLFYILSLRIPSMFIFLSLELIWNTHVLGKFRHLPVVENGEVIAMLDIAKCLYDAISRLEKAAEQGSAIAAAVEGVERQLGGNFSGTALDIIINYFTLSHSWNWKYTVHNMYYLWYILWIITFHVAIYIF